MPWQFGGDGAAPDAGQVIVAGAGSQRRAQVAFVASEQAVSDLPVGGQPDPVARSAKWPGHRSDDADPAGAGPDLRSQLTARA